MKYKYQPIQAKAEIRLVELEPGERQDALRGKIYSVELDRAPAYEALSYVWGNRTLTQTFECPDGVIPITQSLHDAFKRLRMPDQLCRIWADGVCIDQSDEMNEKKDQVRLMRRIYEKAFGVKVYLGEHIEETRLAVNLALRISAAKIASDPPQRVYDHMLEDYGLPPEDDPAWVAFRAIMRRPWFRRVWIIQEFVAAQRVLVMSGEWTGHWLVLMGALVKARKHKITHVDATPIDHNSPNKILTQMGTEAAWRLKWLRENHQAKKRWPLMELLTLCRNSLASVDRDHLFSLLGLASDGNDSALDPEYDEKIETTEMVFTRYARHFIQRDASLDVLYVAGLATPDRFPSWVPDWTKSNGKKANFGGAVFSHLYSASRASKAMYSFTADPNVLLVQGGAVDTISKLGMGDLHWQNIRMINQGLQAAKRWIDEVEEMTKDIHNDPSGQELSEVRWRTLIGNRTPSNLEVLAQDAPDEYAKSYAAAKKYISTIFTDRNYPSQPDADPPAKDVPDDDTMKILATAQPYLEVAGVIQFGVRLCMTDSDYVGLAPTGAKEGDFVYVILGCNVPFVLRRCIADSNTFRLVGECYIHGIMKGEAFDSRNFEVTTLQIR